MSDVLFLDSGPLGLITQPQRSHEVIAITDWLKDCLRAGARVLVPAIVYYEIKRELLRANKANGIARLDAFVNADPDRYVPLTDDALRFAHGLVGSGPSNWPPDRRRHGSRYRCTAGRTSSPRRRLTCCRDHESETSVAIPSSGTLGEHSPRYFSITL